MADIVGEFYIWRQTTDGRRVYAEAVKRARRLKDRGMRRFGIGAIWESIRYDFTLRLSGDDMFRLNNNHRAFLAREIMRNEVDLAGFFELRDAAADGVIEVEGQA